MNKESKGKVWLVGAGCGDIGLMTIKGMSVLEKAEVVVYDALVSLEILAHMPKNAELINVGKRSKNHLASQEEINKILLDKALEGKRVVRLKGGDPFVFGRGGEELELLAENDVPFEVVPGITSSIAVPAYNGIPVTHRAYTSSFHVITGHKKRDEDLDIDFKALAKLDATMVFLMGVAALEEIVNKLMEAGMPKDTPAAILEKGTTAKQKRVISTLENIKRDADNSNIQGPAVIVAGKVCRTEKDFCWVEKMPLFGKNILLTRPKSQISRLASKLRELGAHVIEMPTIETVPVSELEDNTLFENFKLQLEKLTKEKKPCAVFTSPQGVRIFFELMRKCGTDIRAVLGNKYLEFAVIGKGTADTLGEYGITADIMPMTYSAKDLGIALGKSLDKDVTAYVFRAKEGSQDLNDQLEKAEIEYIDIPTYHTDYTQAEDISDKVEQAFEAGEISGVTFTSASTVKGFVFAFENVDFTKVKAYCIGKQTAAEAEKYGMDVSISKEATIDSLVDLISQ